MRRSSSSRMLPALRDTNALLDRLQLRQQALVEAGRTAEGACLWGRINRVARWQAEADFPKFAVPVAPVEASTGDCLDALIAEVNVEGIFGSGVLAMA